MRYQVLAVACCLALLTYINRLGFGVAASDIKSDLGFATYVPDCDTTACSFSAATQFGSQDPILDQPLIDFYAGYQIGRGSNRKRHVEQGAIKMNGDVRSDS